jgi:uncharacterized protein YegP (UPF0339 family)
MGNPKFVIKRSDDQFHFHLTAANGEIILTSERYKTRSSADNGSAAVKKKCRDGTAIRAARVAGGGAVLRAEGGEP